MFGFGKKKAPPSRGKAFDMMDLFLAELKSEGIKYNVSDEKPSVFINYNGDNFDSLTFSFFFDEDGESVSLKVFSIAQFDKSELPDAYEFCNKMNNDWRWFRFYVDGDDEVTADMDAIISTATCGKECLEILQRAVRIVDKVVGELQN